VTWDVNEKIALGGASVEELASIRSTLTIYLNQSKPLTGYEKNFG
jgi:hypothetical protein